MKLSVALRATFSEQNRSCNSCGQKHSEHAKDQYAAVFACNGIKRFILCLGTRILRTAVVVRMSGISRLFVISGLIFRLRILPYSENFPVIL